MVRRAVFVLLGVLLAGPGAMIGPGRPYRIPRAAACVGGAERARAAAARRVARAGARDSETLGHDEVARLLADLARRLRAKFGDSREDRLGHRLSDPITVPVRFHVISAGARGRLSQSAVQGQLKTMNAAYSGATGGVDTGVSFRLEAVDYTDNAAWFGHPQENEKAMKTALRRGGPGTLNLYTAAVGSDVLGFSTFPQWYARHMKLDGVVIDYRSLPGGLYQHFNRGYTAVHEVGHWLGLFHTFENGCDAPGDAVPDTPYEAVPTDGCPWYKDTCWAAGDDPVHNFMDYGYDDCMTQFTAGQGRRIHSIWAAYRAPSAGGSARDVGGAR
jgi:hypothetical protein